MRKPQGEILPVLAEHVLTHSRLAVLGDPVVLSFEVQQGVHAGGGDRDHAAPVAAVAAVRAALGDELLPSEADAAVAAFSATNVDFSAINEHGRE